MRVARKTALARIAAAPQDPYSQRVEAALALSGSHHGAEFGSAELKLLAGDPKSITPASADQPFFYEARVIAAQNSGDARQTVQILSNALADTPARDDARIPLFQAAASVHSDEFALASIEQMLRAQRIPQVVPRFTNDQEGLVSSEEGSEDQEAASVYAPAETSVGAASATRSFGRSRSDASSSLCRSPRLLPGGPETRNKPDSGNERKLPPRLATPERCCGASSSTQQDSRYFTRIWSRTVW